MGSLWCLKDLKFDVIFVLTLVSKYVLVVIVYAIVFLRNVYVQANPKIESTVIKLGCVIEVYFGKWILHMWSQPYRYRIYPCIMRTFFSQILALKSRCALYTEPFVFMLGNLHNNTKSAKSNSFQFYATSRNKSRQKCLSSFVNHFSPRPSMADQSCNLFTITVENLLHFL